MNKNLTDHKSLSDNKKVELMLNDLILLYRELKECADVFSSMNEKNSDKVELDTSAKTMLEIKKLFDAACTAACFSLNNIKESGHRFEINIIRDVD